MNRLIGFALVLLCTLALTSCQYVEHKPAVVINDAIADTTTSSDQQRIHALELQIKELKESAGEHKLCNDTEYAALRDFQNTAFAVTLTLVTLIVGGLGIAAPYLLNRNIQKNLKAEIANILTEIATATENIEKAKSEAIEQATKEAQKISNVTMLGTQATFSDDPKEQIYLYSRILDILPENANVLNNRGNAHNNNKDYTEAIRDYTQAIRLKPEDPIFYTNRAAAYINIEDFDKTEADYSTAIEKDPTYFIAYHNRAILYQAIADQEGITPEQKAKYEKLAEADRAECQRLKAVEEPEGTN